MDKHSIKKHIKVVHLYDEELVRCNKNIEPILEENKKVCKKI